ncbi:lecithin retinol acyltransferase family protein [bacterium]|nr:lecithin retinol acyltransferase family protein [bacterium]
MNTNKYDIIINPKTGRKVSINGKIGRQVLKKYIKMSGGAIVSSILDACLTVDQSKGFDCLHSAESIKFAKNTLIEKQEEWEKSGDFKFDCFFKENEKKDKIEHLFSETYKLGYTPLKPGDILYYPCAVGKLGKFFGAEHASIYIGNGACIHMWGDDGKARIIITSVEQACSSKCNLYILEISKIKSMTFHSRLNIIREAVQSLEADDSHGVINYSAFTNNCHQWVLDIATKRKITKKHNRSTARCLPFKLHIKKSKVLAIKRRALAAQDEMIRRSKNYLIL